jgi:hypothetical protein
MTDQWTSAELFAELQSFEAALRSAGLQPNTVHTYVGRSETFLRWLVGDYSPRGPNAAVAGSAKVTKSRTRGEVALAELRDSMSANELARYLHDYAVVTGYDAALNDFRAETAPSLDLDNRTHAVALVGWLRRWGCRHLRREDNDLTTDALQGWWRRWGVALPGPELTLSPQAAMSDSIPGAYEHLASLTAARRQTEDREVEVRFGDTAAAKTLFAVRPFVFPPWDEPIRVAFEAPRYDGNGYAQLVRLAAESLEGASARFGVTVQDLPASLGRPASTPAKLVDEYLWTKITRGLGREEATDGSHR